MLKNMMKNMKEPYPINSTTSTTTTTTSDESYMDVDGCSSVADLGTCLIHQECNREQIDSGV